MIDSVNYLFINCNSTKDMLSTVALIEPFSDNLPLFFNVVEIYLNRLLQYKADNSQVISNFEIIKDKFSYLAIKEIENSIIECRKKIQYNCSNLAIIDMFVLKFLEGKYKWR